MVLIMEQEKKPFVHDTINLDEIKGLLGDDTDELYEQMSIEEEEEVSPEQLSMQMEESVQEESVESEVEDTSVESEELQETGPAKKTNWAYEIYGMLHDVIYLLAAVTLIFVFFVRLVGVQGESMLPTLHNKDYLLLESNFLYNGSDLEYGDIVVLNVPYFEEQGEGPIVKRIIATEGQTVDIDFTRGQVYVDGVMLHEDYIQDLTYNNWDGQYGLQYPAVVPEGCVFVLGDNRNNSTDSRYAPVGMVDERCVLGKVILVLVPGQTRNSAGEIISPRQWNRIGLIE